MSRNKRRHRSGGTIKSTPLEFQEKDELTPFLFDFNEEDESYYEQKRTEKIQNTRRSTVIDWDDEDLFGDDDAAFVDIAALNSFSVVRADCKKFFDENSKFISLNAPKGSGKTTMCRLLEHNINKENKGKAIWLRDPDISPMPESEISLSDWVNRWTNHISYAILCMLVDKFEGLVADSDLMDIIDIRKNNGESTRGLLKHFIENFKLPFLTSRKIPDQFKLSYQDILSRVDKKLKNKAWIFIDEVDQAFSKNEQLIYKNAGALIACRNLVAKLENVVIRSTIRPNVLTILESEVDSMANVSDAIIPLDWNALQLRGVVAKRIEAYLHKTNNFLGETFESIDERENWLLSQILEVENPNMGLGQGNRPVHITLSVLGKNRPRWVLCLLKEAAKIAKFNGEKLITPYELFGCLLEYGSDRLKNISSEFKSICGEIYKITIRFALSKKTVFYHLELIEFIEKNILNEGPIKIVGISDNASAIDIAELLYLIGFIDASFLPGASSLHGAESLKKNHIDYYKQPILMSSITIRGVEVEKYMWEIHPAFRYALGLERKKWKKSLKNE
jgi:hypothetical protein